MSYALHIKMQTIPIKNTHKVVRAVKFQYKMHKAFVEGLNAIYFID